MLSKIMGLRQISEVKRVRMFGSNRGYFFAHKPNVFGGLAKTTVKTTDPLRTKSLQDHCQNHKSRQRLALRQVDFSLSCASTSAALSPCICNGGGA